MVVRHLARNELAQSDLQAAVTDLFRIRFDAAQKHSSNSCRFESPTCRESLGGFEAQVFGQDLRQKVFMQFGFFGTRQKIVVVSYFDYSGSASPDRFKQRAGALFSSVKVSERV